MRNRPKDPTAKEISLFVSKLPCLMPEYRQIGGFNDKMCQVCQFAKGNFPLSFQID